jgi:hypothetical protein
VPVVVKTVFSAVRPVTVRVPSFAMVKVPMLWPWGFRVAAASVSGFYLAHPEAVYFNVGKVGDDQVRDLALRKGMPLAELERLIAPNM